MVISSDGIYRMVPPKPLPSMDERVYQWIVTCYPIAYDKACRVEEEVKQVEGSRIFYYAFLKYLKVTIKLSSL